MKNFDFDDIEPDDDDELDEEEISQLPPTELRPAHVWTCDRCGTDNFENTIVYEMTEDEEEDMREQMRDVYGEGSEAMNGDWLTIPDYVECKFCGEKYRSVDMHEKDDDIE